MVSVAVLAQALPSASSGVDWLYQFTNNLTNLTTQNGGALTQFGLTELSCISLFVLVSMVVQWNTSSMTFRLHHEPLHVGDLTNFLLRLIVCSLLLELLGQSISRCELRDQSLLFVHRPGDGRRLRPEFFGQPATASQNGRRQHAHAVVYGTGGDPVLLHCAGPARARFRDPVPDQLQCVHPVWRDRALWSSFRTVADDQDLSRRSSFTFSMCSSVSQ